MAAEENEGAEALPEDITTAKPKRKKLIVLAAAGVLLAAVSGGGAYMFLGGEAETAAIHPEYSALPDIIVNMRTSDGKSRFLKARIVLEGHSPEDMEAITLHQPRLIDSFQSFLREVRPEDLNGASGTFRVKEELLVRANYVVSPAKVNDVLIQELVQQ